jgi:hypothetical protein
MLERTGILPLLLGPPDGPVHLSDHSHRRRRSGGAAGNGLQVVARTRTRHRGTATIVLGEESDRGLQRDAKRLGAWFAVRPVTGGKLLGLVLRALDAGLV